MERKETENRKYSGGFERKSKQAGNLETLGDGMFLSYVDCLMSCKDS